MWKLKVFFEPTNGNFVSTNKAFTLWPCSLLKVTTKKMVEWSHDENDCIEPHQNNGISKPMSFQLRELKSNLNGQMETFGIQLIS